MKKKNSNKHLEKSLKKKQAKIKKEKNISKRNKKKKLQYGFLAVVVLAVIVVVYFNSTYQPENVAMIELSNSRINFGTLNHTSEIVSSLISVKNIGTIPLKIDDMVTSCGCTTARMIFEEQSSPLFGMNMSDGRHPTGWAQEIMPGQTATIEVRFDPSKHPDLRGPVTRTVSVHSNAFKAVNKIIYIDANIV